MFKNDQQRAAVCQVVCTLGKVPGTYWTDDGPTEAAKAVLDDRDALSSGERLMVLVAWDVWNGHGKVHIERLLRTLDGDNLRHVGWLLYALSFGQVGVEALFAGAPTVASRRG